MYSSKPNKKWRKQKLIKEKGNVERAQRSVSLFATYVNERIRDVPWQRRHLC